MVVNMIQQSCWVEIDLANISHNIKEIRKIVDPITRIMPIVKNDGYGHGMIEISKTVLNAGADALGVSVLDEAIDLRQAGITEPILLLKSIATSQAEQILRYGITPAVFTMDVANALSSLGLSHNCSIKIHIKIDTGMGRLGVLEQDALEFIKRVYSLPCIEIQGIFSHLANSDESDKTYAEEQFRKFQEICTQLSIEGINIPIKHISNSAAILDLPSMNLDLVRPGISIYGLFPSKMVSRRINLKPAMRFKTRVWHLKTLPIPRYISYGKTYKTAPNSVVAVLSVGYSSGYSRLLSNKAEVLVQGKRANVIGRVTMDNVMIDVTHIPDITIGEEVVLFGTQLNESISIDEVAEIIGTINYEVVCLVGANNPRFYTNNPIE